MQHGGWNKQVELCLSEAEKTQKPTLSHVIVPTALKKHIQQVDNSKVIVHFSFMSDFTGSQLQLYRPAHAMGARYNLDQVGGWCLGIAGHSPHPTDGLGVSTCFMTSDAIR